MTKWRADGPDRLVRRHDGRCSALAGFAALRSLAALAGRPSDQAVAVSAARWCWLRAWARSPSPGAAPAAQPRSPARPRLPRSPHAHRQRVRAGRPEPADFMLSAAAEVLAGPPAAVRHGAAGAERASADQHAQVVPTGSRT